MKLVICCNHSYPHIGGSEAIIKLIAESMASEPYLHDVKVISRSITNPIINNKVEYIPCSRNGQQFITQLQDLKPDHTLIYSDCFLYWTQLLKELDVITGKKSIATVGMNQTWNSNRDILAMRTKNLQGKLNIITHSRSYRDYIVCEQAGIPVNVIPNGVLLEEFDNNNTIFPFLKSNKKMILCVSNFFPGKGQDMLTEVLKRVYKKTKDWYVVFLSSSVNFPFAKYLSEKVMQAISRENYDSYFLVDRPREEVVAAFKNASVFAFPSQKEVAPLVALESQACSVPWVSLPVGNMRDLLGGQLAVPGPADAHGYLRYSEESYQTFSQHIIDLLQDDSLRQSLGKDGRKQVEEQYDWKKIASQYNEVFTT